MLDADLIAEFVRAYQEEFNRLVGDVRKSRAQAERDLSRVNWQIERIIDAITEGMFHPTMKDKMTALEARKAKLEAELQSDETEPPALLHPGLADAYREKVDNLAATLNDPRLKQEAAEAIRGLLSEIRMIPEDGMLAIELVGELAGLLALGQGQRQTPRGCTSGRSTTMVAGVGFGLCLPIVAFGLSLKFTGAATRGIA